MIESEGLTHIHLLVTDMPRALTFYTGVFGMQELFREGDDLVSSGPRERRTPLR